MIIVGNSHVTALKGCRLAGRHGVADEPVAVHWVGSLEVEHFACGHPAAEKVRRLFADHDGWKLLLMGNHDVFAMLRRAHAGGDMEEARTHVLTRYRDLFCELAAHGRFAFVTGLPQTRIDLGIPGLEPDDVAAAAADLHRELKSWCAAAGIPVIDPLPRILDEHGRPDEALLMDDKLHLRREAAHVYFDEIAAVIGQKLVPSPAPASALARFQPRSEPESYCALVLEELALPSRRSHGPEAASLAARIAAVVQARLAERGIELTVDVDSDFVADGLVDSLDLVEIYAQAVEILGSDIPFDVDLRQLGSARRLADYLLEQASGDAAVLTADDFLVSLRGNLDEDPLALLRAEQRIAWMGLERYQQLGEQIAATVGEHLHYGVVHYWLALAEHALGQPEMALERLGRAESPRTLYAFYDARVELRRQRWLRAWDRATPPCLAVTSAADAALAAAVLPPTAGLRIVGDEPPRALLESLRATDFLVGDGPAAALARALGLPVRDRLDPALLLPALAWGRRPDWGQAPLPLPTRARERWVVPAGSSWRPALERLLHAAPAGGAALVIIVPAGAAEATFADVAAACERAGVAPDAAPDIVLIDESQTSPVACFRAATAASCDVGDGAGRALAALLDLAPLPAHVPSEVLRA